MLTMPKKDILMNPYRPGDENRLYFYDKKLLQLFFSSLSLVEKYFRYQVKGLESIPPNAAALLVLNHGLIPFDALLLGRFIYRHLGRRLRILIHRRSWRIPLLREVALNLGAVDANPKNAIRLLKKGELLAVYPGGEREGLKPSSQKYQLLWEGRYGFMEIAFRCQVPIIPCMAVGIDDLFYVFDRPHSPIPFFMGLGGLPIPRKVTHHIGKPIVPPPRSRTRSRKIIRSLHQKVWNRSQTLLAAGLRERRWLPQKVFQFFRFDTNKGRC